MRFVRKVFDSRMEVLLSIANLSNIVAIIRSNIFPLHIVRTSSSEFTFYTAVTRVGGSHQAVIDTPLTPYLACFNVSFSHGALFVMHGHPVLTSLNM